MRLRENQIGVLGVALAALCLSVQSAMPAAMAAEKAPRVKAAKDTLSPEMLEAWPGQRVVLLLPLQIAEGAKIDALLGRAILPAASESLRKALMATGKFSVILPYRFNPILSRAVQEGRISRAELTALVNTPTLESGRAVMAKLDRTFDQSTFIGQFSLEELRFSGTTKDPRSQVQVSGRLYEVDGAGAANTALVTSDTFGGNHITNSVLSAAGDAFARAAKEFTRPLAESILIAGAGLSGPGAVPDKTPAPNPAPVKNPATPDPAEWPLPGNFPPADNVPVPDTKPATTGGATGGARDIVPKLPAPEPPLDINVPK